MKPPLTVVNVVITRQNHLAVYYDITFIDAEGKKFFTHQASMFHDLKPPEVVSKSDLE